MRLDRNTASKTLCVTNTPVAFVVFFKAEQLFVQIVHQQQLGPGDERPRDRHAHLHAAGEFSRKSLAKLAEADKVQHLSSCSQALRYKNPGELEWQGCVILNVASRQQVCILKDEPGRAFIVALGGARARNLNRTRTRLSQTSDNPQKGRFAAP